MKRGALQVRLLPVTSTWLRSSTRQSSRFLPRGDAGSTPAGATRGRTATGAVPRLENGWAATPWGFDSLSFRLRCDVVQTAGRPAVTRWMLVRAQPSQLTRPGLLAGRGCRSLTPATRVRIPLGASTLWLHALGRVWRCGSAVSRVRRVRSPSRALLAVAQWTSTRLLPWPTGVRLLPARLRRKASSEPAGCEPAEQGAIPWRRLGRRRRAGWAGAALMKRTRVVRFHGRRLEPPRLSSGCREAGHPAGFGNRRPLVRLQPARSVLRAERDAR